MNTDTVAAPLGAPSFSATADVTPGMAALYAKNLEASKRDSLSALSAMRALWRWICAMVDKLARALGLRVKQTEEPSDAQMRGEQDMKLELESDGSPGAPAKLGADPKAAAKAIFDEAERLIQHLTHNPIDTSILSDADSAREFVRWHAEKLGLYHRAYALEADASDQEIQAKCEAIALTQGTSPAVVRAILASGSDGGLIDKDEALREAIKRSDELRLGMRRAELAAASLVSATEAPSAVAGLRDYAVAMIGKYIPSVDLGRMAAPPASVAQASGETSAIGVVASANLDSANSTPLVDAVSQQHVDAKARSSFAQDIPYAKTTALESGPLQGQIGVPKSVAAQAPAASDPDLPQLTEEAVQEAMSSPLVARNSFASVADLARNRRGQRAADWGDMPSGG